ncbi:MAG: hypothetical protein K5765_06855 [Clostridia bacterium]|nr:hypothetical protein [Clostridia bacterium]
MENQGNPYHDQSGKFTSKENQGSGVKESSEKELSAKEAIENGGKAFEDFSEALEKAGIKSSSKKEQPKDLDSRIDSEIADFNRIKEKFNWNDTPEEVAENIAKGLSDEGLGEFEEIKAKVMEKLESEIKEAKPSVEVPNEITISDESDITIDVDEEDVLDFLKQTGIELSKDELEDFRRNNVLPPEYFDKDSLEDLTEFIRARKSKEIEEIEEDDEGSDDPYSFYGVKDLFR